MDNVSTRLSINKVYEYYDVPQVVLMQDESGIEYLCTLYDINEYGTLEYIGTNDNIDLWMEGYRDLRSIYVNAGHNYYISYSNGIIEIIDEITRLDEFYLPREGFYINEQDL